jgi:hypothetical protein
MTAAVHVKGEGMVDVTAEDVSRTGEDLSPKRRLAWPYFWK